MEAASSGHDDGRYDFSSRGAKVLREFFSPGDGEVPTSSVEDFKDALIELISALEVLSNIVNHATQLCSELGEDPQVVRWDRRSLYQIVGKFDKTFEECEEIALMSIKQHVGLDRAHIVDWNPQVLTRVQQLHERMLSHRQRLRVFLRPFETDLLSRLRDRLSTPQPRMRGILIANLEAELDRLRTMPPVTLPDIPADIMAAFDRQAYADEFTFSPLEGCNDFFKYWRLSPLSAHSKPNHPLEPSVKEYISFLKCIWLLRKMQKHFSTYAIYPQSHWLSFVKALEEDLDIGCRRIGDRLKPPVINVAKLPQSLLFFRSEIESTQLIGTTTQEPTMRQVYTGALESNNRNITRKVQLLRYQSGQRFRIRISGTEIAMNGTGTEQTETIDIDLAHGATDLIPLYALPEGNGDKAEFIIKVRSKIARLSFPRMNNVLNFQQALTGYKSWDRHCQYNVLVNFVITGYKEPLMVKACLQLWIPKYLDGELVADSGEPITDYNQSTQVQQAADKRRNIVEATEPRIILFTQDPRSSRLSYITVTLQPDMSVNPERCDCRRGGRVKCTIATLERGKSCRPFDICEYGGSEESQHMMDWSMNKLINKKPSSILSDVRRVSFMFSDAESRAKFSGTPTDCQCDIKTNHSINECLRKGHKGLLGEVQEFERRRQLQLQARNRTKITEDNDVDWPNTSEDNLTDSDLPNTSQVGATLEMPESHSAIPSVVDHIQALSETAEITRHTSHKPEDRSYRRRRFASAHVNRRNDAFLSRLGSLIGRLHLVNRGWSQIIVAIQKAVIAGKKLLALVQLVWEHDPTTQVILMEQSTSFMQAIIGLERIIQDDPFGGLTEEEDILVAQKNIESSNLLIVATRCVREAGAYVVEMRQTIESVGDFEVTPENANKLEVVARGETLGMTNPKVMSGGVEWAQLFPDWHVKLESGKNHAPDDLSTNSRSAAEAQSTGMHRTESPAAEDLVEVDSAGDSEFGSYRDTSVPESDLTLTATDGEDLGTSSNIEQSSTLPSSTATTIHPSELIVRAVDLLESVMFTLKYIPGDEEHTRIDEVMVDNCYKQMSAASRLVEIMLSAQPYGRADGRDRLNEDGFDAHDQATSSIRNALEYLKHAMSRHFKADQVKFLYNDRRLTRNSLGDIIDALTDTIHQLRQASTPIASEVELGNGAFSGFKGASNVLSTKHDAEIYLQLSVALRQAGDVEGAMSQLVYVDEVLGKRAASDNQLILDSRVELAKLYMSTGRYDSATAPLLRNMANESFQYDRDNVYQLAAVNMLAIAFRANQQPDRACQVLGLDFATISSLASVSPADVVEASLAEASSCGDSGYSSLEHSSASAKTAQVTSAQMEAGTYDNETLYSVESVTPKSRDVYIDEFSHRLADDIRQLSISLHPSEPSYPKNLPLLLKSFARRLHAESVSRSEREVSVFLHKYRGTIVESLGLIPIDDPFEQEDSDEDFEEDDRFEMDIGLPFKKPESDVNDWVTALEAEMSAHTEILPLEDQTAIPAAADGPPAVDEYQTFVKQSEAYNWLLAMIKGSWRLTTPGPSTAMSDIGESITCHFLSQLSARKVSRRTAPAAIETKISLEWDLHKFIEEQQYGVSSAEVLDRAICLTGTWREAQATTAAEYLKEVWPLTWEPLYALLKEFLASSSGNMCKNETANGSLLCCEQLGSTFLLTIRGKLDFVLETAEQLAWLSSALRTSPISDGVVTCTPSLSVIGTGAETMANKIDAVPSASFHMQFHQEESTALNDTESLSTGFCWSNLFRNPTIVSGYPILHRTKSNTGLDISVACMAKLIDSDQIFQIAGRIILKGFCSMLVATEVAKDVVMWHLLYNASGARISFCDERLDVFDLSKSRDVSLGALESRRHIVGWCGSIQEYTGHPQANREILPSSLPGPAKSFVIEKIYAEGGSNLIGGLIMSVGIRDKPVYLPRAKSYSGLLDWVSVQPIIFYDIDDRRAWLIDGASALLHLVRASVDQDRKKPAYRSKWKFDGSLDGDTVYGGGTIAAIETLSNIANLNRSLYLDDIRPLGNGQVEEVHYYFRDRVQETLHYLQVLIDYQAQVAAQDGYWFRQSGKILTKSVIGFDFWDIAKPPGPIRPRAYHLRTGGHGWIEYIRSIRATTIFGRKFGELLQAQNQHSLCPDWRSVPLGMDYLGVSVATLKAIHEARNEAMMSHGEITSDIVWSSKIELFSQCGCVSSVLPSSKHLHVDPVQLLLPKGQKIHLQVPKVHGNVTLGKLGDEGAVLFSHTPYRIGVRPPRDGVSSLLVTPEDDDAEKSIGSAAMSSVSTASDYTARATATTKSNSSQLTDMTSVFSRQSSQQTLSGSIQSSAVDRQKSSKVGDGTGKEKEEPKKSLFRRLGLGKGKK